MVPVSWLVRVLAFAFMALSMFGIGLQTTAGDMRAMVGSGGRLGRMLAANFILVPAVGVVVARTLISDPAVSTAFLLLACTPGGVSALNYSPYIKGAAAFAGGSAVLLSCLSIFVSPLLLRLALPGDVAVVVPYGRLVALLLLLFLLPLAVGMAVRRLREGFAARLALPCIVAAVVAATVAGWLIATEQKQAVQAVGPRVLVTMLGFVLLSMLIGWLMSGGEKALRPVYVIVTGMRNVAVCLLIALHTFPDLRVQTALVAFSALMVFPNMAVYYYHLARRVGPKLRTSATEKARHLRQGRQGPE